jgi:hypothetical protein
MANDLTTSCQEVLSDRQEGPTEPVGAIPTALTFSERGPSNEFCGHWAASDPNDIYVEHLLYAFAWPSRDSIRSGRAFGSASI